MEKLGNLIIDKLKKVIYYISLALIIIIIVCMIALPFGIKNTKFKNDDLVIKNKTYNVISMDGKVNIKLYGEYVNTGISYNKYTNYIKSYNKNTTFKRSIVIELYLLFILLEFICIHYIITNIIKLFIDKETDDYRLYVNKRSFVINVLSIYVIDFLRRLFFKNTIFTSLSFGLVLYYILSILVMYITLKIIEIDKLVPLKEKKKYGKNKEDN
ncbi:MAG: hypothetical protein IKZ96_02265 [Bacilli bacterium]|nr:hypothetical protein [Bacilli bacterium]